VLALAALALALMAAAYGPQKVMAAFQAILGYIPGIGFVQQDDNTKYLAAPLSVKQDGTTLTVDQAVADVDGVVISYHMEGLPAVKPGEGVVCVFSDNKVRLPDGKDRLPIGGEVIGTKARIEFAPLPNGVNQLTLLVHGEPACPAPIDWSLDIPFGTIAPQPALPVAEVTPMATETPTTQTATVAVPTKSEDVRMTVEKTVALADGWLITGHITWDNPEWESVYALPESITVTDATGKQIPVEPFEESLSNGEFAFKLKAQNVQSPYSLNVGSMMINGRMKDGPTFSFEAGDKPGSGQRWEIGKTLDALGQPVTIQKVEVMTFEDGNSGYAVFMEVPVGVNVVNLLYAGPQKILGSFGQGFHKGNIFRLEMGFPGGMPVGKVTLKVSDLQWTQSGSWGTTWSMPSK
jgi:hypothetical protein